MWFIKQFALFYFLFHLISKRLPRSDIQCVRFLAFFISTVLWAPITAGWNSTMTGPAKQMWYFTGLPFTPAFDGAWKLTIFFSVSHFGNDAVRWLNAHPLIVHMTENRRAFFATASAI